MKKQIWKFPLQLTQEQEIEVPSNSEILCVQSQRDVACLWISVHPNNPTEKITIITYGTGHDIDRDDIIYIGTYQIHVGSLVFHCFEKI